MSSKNNIHFLFSTVIILWLYATDIKVEANKSSENIYCDINPSHVLCQRKSQSDKCGSDFHSENLTDENKSFILFLHNSLRNEVALGNEKSGSTGPQPPSANMLRMEWDDELQSIAQAQSDLCVLDQYCVNCTRVERFEVGRNMYQSFSSDKVTEPDWQHTVTKWFSEVEYFDNGQVLPFILTPATGHYSQMLWWNSRSIGCGSSTFRKNDYWISLYTCIYGPTGNLITAKMYNIGTACNGCPKNTKCSQEYQGLCESTSNISQNENAESDDMSNSIVTLRNFKSKYPDLVIKYDEMLAKESSSSSDDLFLQNI